MTRYIAKLGLGANDFERQSEGGQPWHLSIGLASTVLTDQGKIELMG